jgi:hypothetical protein
MARDTELDIRGEVVALLMEKIVSDKYPSVTMLDMIEQLANTEERSSYAQVLMDKVNSARYPSIPLLQRLLALG